MEEIIRSIARSTEDLACRVSDSKDLTRKLRHRYPRATAVEIRRGALYALTRPGIDPETVDVIYDCALRLKSPTVSADQL